MKIKEKISSWLYRHPALNPIWIFSPGIFRLITSPVRILPDFLIIGAGKSGTTSLYNYLIQHQNIHAAKDKELNYFFRKWTTFYRPNFPTIFSKFYAKKIRKEPYITGESSPFYLIHPQIPKLVKDKIPNVKIIVFLRNPIERAYSQYNHQHRVGYETRSFEDAIKQEKIKTKNEWAELNEWGYGNMTHSRYSYLEGGMYYQQLKAWMEYFPQNKFLIIQAEKFFSEPMRILEDVFNFLEVPSCKINTKKKFNEGTYPELNPQFRRFLLDFFKSHNEKLYKLLGKNFDWN